MPDEMQNLTPPRGLIERLGSRLARVTTSGRRIRELDGLRFIAIFVVVVGHAMEFVIARYPADHPVQITAIPNLFGRMRLGVELFFVISGFILAMPFAQQHLMKERAVSLRAYYWRRVTRLEPPYILTMLLWFAVAVLFWGESGRDLFPHLLASLGYVHNIVYKGFSTINPVAWSLEIEVQFYILAPLLAIMFKINHRWTRRLVIIGAMVLSQQIYRLLFIHFPGVATVGGTGGTLLNYLSLFLAGFFMADVYLTDWKQQPRPSWYAETIAIVGWLILPLYWMPQLERYARSTLLPFILLVLFWASFRSNYVRRFLASTVIMTIGGMCYSLYLLHFPMQRIMAYYSPIPAFTRNLTFNTILYNVIWGIPVLIATAIFFLAIEKPCMIRDWPQLLLARLRKPPVRHAEPAVVPADNPSPPAPMP